MTGGDSASEVSVSCSSTDDTASVGPSSSSPEGIHRLGSSWTPEEETLQCGSTIAAGRDGGGGGGGEAEEEAKDRVTEVLRRSCLTRNSIRSLSPLRRHSWGPGKNNGGDAEMNQRRWWVGRDVDLISIFKLKESYSLVLRTSCWCASVVLVRRRAACRCLCD